MDKPEDNLNDLLYPITLSVRKYTMNNLDCALKIVLNAIYYIFTAAKLIKNNNNHFYELTCRCIDIKI